MPPDGSGTHPIRTADDPAWHGRLPQAFRRVDLRHPRLDGFGEGPTQMGGGSFVQPWEGTNRDIHFTLSSNRINLTSLTSVQPLGSTAVPRRLSTLEQKV
jgi:hypothetical protein